MNLASDLEQFDYRYLLERALSKTPNDIDTRQGSFTYDHLAPFAMELAEMYMQLALYYQATFVQTAFDNYLDLRVAEQGLSRHQATRAVRLGQFTNANGDPMVVPIGARFATIHPTNSVIFTVITVLDAQGDHELECTELGTIGNDYIGELLPVDHINGLGSASMSTLLTPGQNIETDDSLRSRFLNAVNSRAFGGNVVQYKQEVGAIDGVGAVQIHPTWDGGGTVKVSILSSDHNPVSSEFIANVQNQIDPRLEGLGLGLAPIGHKVTVDTATRKEIAVTIDIVLTGDVGVNLVRNDINNALSDYFLTLRKNWDIADDFGRYSVTVFRSQIISLLVNVQGVGDVANVKLDDQESNIVLAQTGQLQELPYVGEVTINAN